MTGITGPDGTSPERYRYLVRTNVRLKKFVVRAKFWGWEVTPSAVAPDTVVVRPAGQESGDHFVLYPRGQKRSAALTVYDGRDGYEFSPLPARDALRFISENGVDS
jgi:hypothetical protein